jgi:hypothetical protein
MLDSCNKHPHEKGAALCRRCGLGWCGACLVYSFGPKKPPYCMSCAMYAGGVKSSSALPAMSRKELKNQMRALKAQAKAEAKAAAAADAQVEPEPVPALAETDWATPWWEDSQPTAMAD